MENQHQSEKYEYKTAFCIMLYQCELCGKKEELWNSRDGVTPFIINCVSCGGSAQHINWGKDECIFDYNSPSHTRVFVNLTLKKAIEYSKKRVESAKSFEEGKFYFDVEDYKNIERFINIVIDMYKGGTAPDIISSEEYKINKLQKEADIIESNKMINEILNTRGK